MRLSTAWSRPQVVALLARLWRTLKLANTERARPIPGLPSTLLVPGRYRVKIIESKPRAAFVLTCSASHAARPAVWLMYLTLFVGSSISPASQLQQHTLK